MRTLVLLLLMACANSGTSQTPQKGEKHFSDIVKPSGWQIPPHGHALGTESISFGKNHEAVKVVRCRPLDHFALPTYYQNEQGTLVLSSFYFHAKVLYALEFNGVRFGYTALAEGEGLGIAGPVYWLDMDGDGTFERIWWGSNEKLELPKWVEQSQK